MLVKQVGFLKLMTSWSDIFSVEITPGVLNFIWIVVKVGSNLETLNVKFKSLSYEKIDPALGKMCIPKQSVKF